MSHIQIIVDGAVQFSGYVESVEFNPVLHEQGQPPCEMRVTIRYGERRPDGVVEWQSG